MTKETMMIAAVIDYEGGKADFITRTSTDGFTSVNILEAGVDFQEFPIMIEIFGKKISVDLYLADPDDQDQEDTVRYVLWYTDIVVGCGEWIWLEKNTETGHVYDGVIDTYGVRVLSSAELEIQKAFAEEGFDVGVARVECAPGALDTIEIHGWYGGRAGYILRTASGIWVLAVWEKAGRKPKKFIQDFLPVLREKFPESVIGEE